MQVVQQQPIIIANLERTQSNEQHSMKQTENLTMGATINNESTKPEPPP